MRSSRKASSISLVIVVAMLAVVSTTFVEVDDFLLRSANAQQQQQGEPRIELMNPSSHSNELSDKPETEGATLQAGEEGTYHFVAWTRNAPAGAIVEFELQQGDNKMTLGRATRRGPNGDAWDLFMAIPTHFPLQTTPTTTPTPGQSEEQGPPVDDGAAIVRVFLFPGENQDPYPNQSSASGSKGTDEQAVEINQQDDDDEGAESPEDEAETVEITSPDNGARLGFYNRAAVIDVAYSAGTDNIAVFYTVSLPGSEPSWEPCGEEAARTSTQAADQGEADDGIRCTLADDSHHPQFVTGVAAVPSNQVPMVVDPIPVEEPDPDSGDAHRVVGYDQIPSAVSIEPAQRNNQSPGSCTPEFELLVQDQEGKKVAGVDVDVHAVGPDDALSFDTSTQTDPNKPPESNHTATEAGRDCASNQFGGEQGEHNRPALNSDDLKHIEDLDGTSDAGTFTFRLWSPVSGTTQITGWADNNPDDRFCQGEPFDAASIGWGESAPNPVALPADNCATATATSTTTTTQPATTTSTTPATTTSTSPGTGTSTSPGTATSTSPGTATSTSPGTATSTSPGASTSTSPGASTSTSPSTSPTDPVPPDQAAELVLLPSEGHDRPGTEQTYTARVTSTNGNPVQGASISWTMRGVGRFVSTQNTTDATGAARAVVTSSAPGDQAITASVSCTGGLCSDTSVQHWGPPQCTIFGTNGEDTLFGTAERDVVCGFRGDDLIRGLAGDDRLLAHRGFDVVRGGSGDDFLGGGKNNDRMFGGSGDDRLRGARGNDFLNGGGARDVCIGGPGRDRYRGCEQRR